MSEKGYLNFDLEIQRAAQGYSAEVISSPAGEARADIPPPLLTQLDQTGSQQAIGAQLFDAVFRDEVLSSLRRSLDGPNGRARVCASACAWPTCRAGRPPLGNPV